MNTIKSLIANWILPPKVLEVLLKNQRQVFWSGRYDSWEQAQAFARGYADPEILTKVLKATKKVQHGEAAFERDSVAFSKPEYTWEVLSSLLYVATKNKNRVSIVDFGGALGSIYFQHRAFFDGLTKLQWSVVEQKHFVEAGNREIKNKELAFFNTIDESLKKNHADLLLLSGVLPYLEEPYDYIKRFLQHDFRYILLARTPCFDNNLEQDVVTIQTVREPIYNAQYPAWLFSKKKILKPFLADYRIRFDVSSNAQSAPGTTYRSIFLEKK